MNFFSKYFFKAYSSVVGNYIARRNYRTQSVLKNVGIGFIAKGISILISFIQVPVTLSILNKTEYGVWLTIYSVVSWFLFFDFGIGNGLKNKLTESLAENKINIAQNYISTAYISLTLIFTAAIFVFFIVSWFLPWSRILNAPASLDKQIVPVIYLCFASTLANFVAALVHVVFAAHHQTGKSNLILLVGQVLMLIAIITIKQLDLKNAFFYIALVLSLTPFLLNIVISVFVYRSGFSSFAPKLNCFKKEYLKDILSVGLKFFVIQIAALIIFTTDNFLLSHLYSPDAVTYYNITYKYFSIITMAFAIICEPLWPMYTDAYKRRDISWINNNVRNLLKILGLLIIVVLGMTLSFKTVFRYWVGKDMIPSLLLVGSLALYTLQGVWNNIFAVPLNSISKLDWQMYPAIFAGIINIPLAFLFSGFIHNPAAIVIANISSLLLGSIMIVRQYKKYFVLRS